MADFVSVVEILRARTLTKPKDSVSIAVELVAILLLKRELAERRNNEQGVHKVA